MSFKSRRNVCRRHSNTSFFIIKLKFNLVSRIEGHLTNEITRLSSLALCADISIFKSCGSQLLSEILQ